MEKRRLLLDKEFGTKNKRVIIYVPASVTMKKLLLRRSRNPVGTTCTV
jgi:hypothetical protein